MRKFAPIKKLKLDTFFDLCGKSLDMRRAAPSTRNFVLNPAHFQFVNTFTAHGFRIWNYQSQNFQQWDLPDFQEITSSSHIRTIGFTTVHRFGDWVSDYSQDVRRRNFEIGRNQHVRLAWRLPNQTPTSFFYQTPISSRTGREGLLESVERFRGYLYDLLQRYDDENWNAILLVQLVTPENNDTGRILRGVAMKTRLANVYNNYIVFDAPSKSLCVFKALFKGYYIHQKKNLAACCISGHDLNDRASKFKRCLVKYKYLEQTHPDQEWKALDIIRATLKYWKEKCNSDFRVLFFDFSFKVCEDIIFGSPEPSKIIGIRDNGKGHAQLILEKEFIKNFLDNEEFQTLFKNENALYCKTLEGSKEKTYWCEGDRTFIFRGKEYSRARLNEVLYQTGHIVKDQLKIRPKPDIILKGLRNFASFDLETIPDEEGNEKAFLSGLYYVAGQCEVDTEGLPIYEQFSGADPLLETLQYLHEHKEEYRDRTIYAHNGGKFDFFLLMETVLLKDSEHPWRIKHNATFIICGGITAFTLYHEKDIKLEIHFKDSCRLIASSLDGACSSFQTRTKKLTSFDIVKARHRKDDISVMREILKYHYNDLECLYQVIEIFQNRFYKMTDFEENQRGMDIVQFMTISQAAINVFLQKCLHFTPLLFTSPPILDRLFRNYFYGGRCEIFKQGLVAPPRKLLYLDINSLYPDRMLEKMPYGKHAFFTRAQGFSKGFFHECVPRSDGDILDETFFGFVHCKVWQKDYEKWKHFPQYVPYHNGQILHFPFFDIKHEVLLFAPEILMIQNMAVGGYHFEFLNFIQCDSNDYLRRCILKLYDVKKEAGKNGDEAMRNTSKLIQNSLFGYFGIGMERECIKFLSAEESKDDYVISEAFQEGRLLDINKCGETVIVRTNDMIDIRCSKVETSSAITSYARMKQWQAQVLLIQEGHSLVLGDTDSIVFMLGCTPKEFTKGSFYKNWIVGGQQEELGKEKDEFFKIAKKAFKGREDDLKEYLERYSLTLKDELIPFDECVVAAAKSYYCFSEFKGVRLEKHALKGGNIARHNEWVEDNPLEAEEKSTNKVNYESFKKALSDPKGVLVLQQKVFKSGVPSFFDPKSPFRVRVEKNEKKFVQLYRKGKALEDDTENTYKTLYPYKLSEIIKMDGSLQKYPIQKVIEAFL